MLVDGFPCESISNENENRQQNASCIEGSELATGSVFQQGVIDLIPRVRAVLVSLENVETMWLTARLPLTGSWFFLRKLSV